jgi:hypothetical protein
MLGIQSLRYFVSEDDILIFLNSQKRGGDPMANIPILMTTAYKNEQTKIEAGFDILTAVMRRSSELSIKTH